MPSKFSKLIGLAKRTAREAQSIVVPNAYQSEGIRYYAEGGDRGLRHNLPWLNPSSVALDIGGYRGDWAADIYARHRCQIHVFEPVPGFAAEIESRFEQNPDIHVHALGLGGTTREENIRVGASDSSVYLGKGKSATIRFETVGEWMESHLGDQIVDLAKINIEGGEFELLEAMIEAGLLSRFRAFQIQFHSFAPDAETRRSAIREELAKTHLESFCYDWIWEEWRAKGES
jgi:FkbM family methyltransferase